MYSLDSLSIRNFHLFREANLPFRKGITTIMGENYSGKSLLTSAIPTALSLIYKDEYEAAPKSSFIGLKYHKDELAVDYTVTTHASAKYAIGLGGKDQQPHKKVDAKNLLLQNWSIPQALFESTIFLRGIDRHPLSMGTPGTRSEWLSKALDLVAIYDAYKIEVDNRITELGKQFAKKEVLQEELEKAESRIPDSTISKDKAEKARRMLKKHRAILNDLPAEKDRLQSAISILDHIEALPHIDFEPINIYQKKLATYQKRLAELQTIQDSLEDYREAVKHNKEIQSKLDKLVSEMPLISEKTYRKLSKKVEECDAIIEAFSRSRDAYADQQDERTELSKFKKFKPQTTSLEEANNLRGATLFRRGQIRESLESLTSLKLKDQSCPTCGNPLTKDHMKKEARKLKAELESIPNQLKYADKEIRYWELQSIDWAAKPEKPEFSSKEYNLWQRQVAAYEMAEELTKQLKPIKKVKASSVEDEISKLEHRIKKMNSLIRAATSYSNYVKMLPEDFDNKTMSQILALKPACEQRLEQIKLDIKYSQDIVKKYAEVEVKYDLEKRMSKQHRSIVSDLKAHIADLAEDTKDIQAYKALSVAFGNSGVRLYQLKESAAALSAKLTELSALFFDSTYYFNIEVAPHKLNVHVERNGKTGSLKTLSGAETRSWSLLCAMALIRALPSSMRCDTIFLDEIEANMNKRSRERYVRDVLPELNTIIPKIVVVSPLTSGELPLTPDYDYRVVKEFKKGEYVSRLLEN